MLNRSLPGIVVAIVVLLSSAAASAQSDEHFPRPAELEPAIDFWKRVYTQIDSDYGFLHDAGNLGVIYRRVPYDREQIEQYRRRIQQDLQVLAGGKRSGLTGHQQQVLEAWPEDVSDQELSAAANRVRIQRGQSDRFVAGLIRSGAYREHIEQVAREKGLPVELAALPHVESSFHPGAHSHANAAGMWQFMRSTGQRFMRIDHVVDQRMDPYTATYAAMSLLEYNYNVLDSWPLALTAYNHGAGGMARAVREVGSDRIEDVISGYRGRAFGFASRNFYSQFLAVLEVERQARALFGVLQLDPAPDYEEFEMHAYVEAGTLADALGVSLEQLRFDNPALRPVVWDGGKRIPEGYTVKIQSSSIDRSMDRLIASIPGDRLYTHQTPDVDYVVQRGDSLSVIADRFDTTVSRLVSLNNLASRHRIRVGQTVLLPHDTQQASETLLAAERPTDGVYDVRRGDTLSLIASRFDVSETELMRANDLNDPDRIYPGQSLRLPAPEDPSQAPENEGEEEEATAVASTPQPVSQAEDEPVSSGPATADLTAVTFEQPAGEMAPEEEGSGEDSREQAQAIAEQPASEDAPAISPEEAEQMLGTDPSDYSVADNRTIEIQASETLGHYADWLELRTQSLRNLNGMRFSEPVVVGDRLELDFSQVDIGEFERRRREYHIAQQQRFFANHRIQNLDQYQVTANDNIARIARNRYSVPLWLLRQYNPDLNFRQVRVGDTVVFPVVETVDDA